MAGTRNEPVAATTVVSMGTVADRSRSRAAAAAEAEATPNPPSRRAEAASGPPSSSPATTANLANLLPTGTLLAFNLLAPTFTNHGACDATTSLLTRALLAVLAVASALACFTDSLKSPHDGRVYYGVATGRSVLACSVASS